jgi:hypothetical protein
MASQRRAAQLADEFAASYPDTLPRRLAWLAEHLRIDRSRFLRLIGLAPEEVEANFAASWEAIAERWPEGAQWAEQLLSELIALFGYDWRALANRLHRPAESGARPGPEGVWRPAGQVGLLPTLAPRVREETLLALLSQGGPDVHLWLIEYLMQPAANGQTPRQD